MGLTFGVRSVFLTLFFPPLINAGRGWFSGTDKAQSEEDAAVADGRVSPEEGVETESTPLLPRRDNRQNSTDVRFDLWFLTTSFFADAVLTAATAQCETGWQLCLGSNPVEHRAARHKRTNLLTFPCDSCRPAAVGFRFGARGQRGDRGALRALGAGRCAGWHCHGGNAGYNCNEYVEGSPSGAIPFQADMRV